jgi:hypothetical protein
VDPVSTSVGNADYLKVQGSYSTGLMDNGFQHHFYLSSTTGVMDMLTELNLKGKIIFIAFGYKPKRQT